ELTLYSKEKTDAIKSMAQKTAKNLTEDLKATSPKATSKYAGGWKVKKTEENANCVTYVVHNASRPYLTHLLEFGHAKRGGGRVSAQPHIAKAEQKAITEFERGVENE
ncbi:MAG: HK97 gp10 family phage protein, partial [Christensenellaceae bacterium]